MNKEQIDKLAELYSRDTTYAYIVATICDEILDKSGSLLGQVRVEARKIINGNQPTQEEIDYFFNPDGDGEWWNG